MGACGCLALTYSEMVEMLRWLWSQQMYLWKLERTTERLDKAKNELIKMVTAAEGTMKLAEHNNRRRIEMADGWVNHGKICIDRADDVIQSNRARSIANDDPTSIDDIWSRIAHCPCEAVDRRNLNAKAIMRMNEILAHIKDGMKYATNEIKDVSYSIIEGPSPPPVFLHGTNSPLMNKSSFLPAGDTQHLQLRGIPKYRAIKPSTRLTHFPVVIRVDAPAYFGRPRAPVDLVMVLDASTSMCADGMLLDMVKQGSMFVIHNLDSKDRLSIVKFGKQKIVLPLRHMSTYEKGKANRKVQSLKAVGTSTFGAAMDIAYKILDDRPDKSSVANILLLTGGAKGILEKQSLRNTQAYWNKRRDYPTYTFGFGFDHDPRTLYNLATGGRGTYSFVIENTSIRDAMALYIGGLTSIVAQNVQISVASAHQDVEISSMECGGHTQRLAHDRKSGFIYIKDLYASEEKNFIAYVNIPEEEAAAKTKLLTVKAKYYCPLARAEGVSTGEVDVFVERPVWDQDSNMSIEVASEVTRAKILNGVKGIWLRCRLNFRVAGQGMDLNRQLDDLANSIHETEEAKAAGEKWDDLKADLKNMKDNIWDVYDLISRSRELGVEEFFSMITGSPYMLSWLSSHIWQRAATPGFVSSSRWFSFRTVRMQNMIDSVEDAPGAYIQ